MGPDLTPPFLHVDVTKAGFKRVCFKTRLVKCFTEMEMCVFVNAWLSRDTHEQGLQSNKNTNIDVKSKVL